MNTQSDARGPSDRYEIFYDDRACEDIDSLAQPDYERIDGKIVALGDDPRPPGCTKLADGLYRVRVGPWRVIYVVDDAARRVIISRVKRRTERTYSRL